MPEEICANSEITKDMPKFTELRKRNTDATAKTGDTTRQLAFAGLALIWLFKEQTETNGITLEKNLVIAGFVLVVSLAFDLMQSAGTALLYFLTLSHAEALKKSKDAEASKKSKDSEDDDIEYSYSQFWINVLYILWWFKIFLVAAAYFILLSFLANKFL